MYILMEIKEYDSFDKMSLKDNLPRGIYAYGLKILLQFQRAKQ